MLVLTLKSGQFITIGDDIRVSVQKGKYGQLHIGIDAPKDLLVLRDELIDDIATEEQSDIYLAGR